MLECATVSLALVMTTSTPSTRCESLPTGTASMWTIPLTLSVVTTRKNTRARQSTSTARTSSDRTWGKFEVHRTLSNVVLTVVFFLLGTFILRIVPVWPINWLQTTLPIDLMKKWGTCEANCVRRATMAERLSSIRQRTCRIFLSRWTGGFTELFHPWKIRAYVVRVGASALLVKSTYLVSLKCEFMRVFVCI